MTFTPRYNVYADKNGVATHEREGNTLVISAGSPVALKEAERLKLPELETIAAQKAEIEQAKSALKPAEFSVADAKILEKAGDSEPVTVPIGAPKTKTDDAPNAAKGDK